MFQPANTEFLIFLIMAIFISIIVIIGYIILKLFLRLKGKKSDIHYPIKDKAITNSIRRHEVKEFKKARLIKEFNKYNSKNKEQNS
jgi:hypothetical protein